MGARGRNKSRWGWTGAALILMLAGSRSPAIAQAAPVSPPTIRALFVGIDSYQHSFPRAKQADPDFHDLHGAVNDMRLMQKALAAYRVPVAAQDCDPGDDRSITLIDDCATRNNIIGALEHLISASKPGELIVFYYAGHGSQHSARGRAGADQVSGKNSTVVPADAWRPPPDDDTGSNDILDVDFKHLIDEADRVGVSVVTIFDSCHSGSATRNLDALNGATRAAPDDLWRAKPELTWSAPQPSASGSVNRYRVHMAGAGDDEVAHEWPDEVGQDRDGKPILEIHGAFTKALADTLGALKGATYLDIAQETRWRMSQEGRPQQVTVAAEGFCGPTETCTNAGAAIQHTQEEGELAAPFLGAAPDPGHGYQARVAAAGATSLQINGGSVSGVTSGSTFRVYASQGLAATSKDAFLATGTVDDTAYDTATLRLDAPLKSPASLGQAEIRDPNGGGLLLWAQEQIHAYGPDRLPLAIVGDTKGAADRLTDAVGGLSGEAGVFQIAGPVSAAYFLTVKCGQVAFQTRAQAATHPAGGAAACPTNVGPQPEDDPYNPSAIWRGALSDADFAADLAAAARTVANFNALLNLRKDRSRHWGCVSILPDGVTEDPCQSGVARPGFIVRKGPADFWLTNTTQGPLYRYALFLDADTYGVSVIDPPPSAKDPPLAAGERIDFFSGQYQRGGHGVVLVLLTRDEINVSALRQAPVRGADGAPKNELERLLLNAASGTRGVASPRLAGDYDAVAVDVIATDNGAPAPAGTAVASSPVKSSAPVAAPPASDAGAQPTADEDQDGGRIIGGADASLGDAPYQVEIAWEEDSPLPEWAIKTVQHPWAKTALDDHHCGGALIAKDWVLTAQHCVIGDGGKPIAPADLVVRAGAVSITIDGARELNPRMRVFAIEPDGIILYPGYKPSGDYSPPVNDLALIHLATAVPLDPPNVDRKRFAIIALAPRPYRAGPIVVTGWGSMKANTGVAQEQREDAQTRMNSEAFVPAKDFVAATVRMAPNLQIATLNVVRNASCAKQVLAQIRLTRQGVAKQNVASASEPVMKGLSDDYLCAGDDGWKPSARRKATCQGDSGGPLAAPNQIGFDPALVAVVGWAVGCAQAPGVYTRITPRIVNWVHGQTGIPVATLVGSAQ